jgi:hypothetical protein
MLFPYTSCLAGNELDPKLTKHLNFQSLNFRGIESLNEFLTSQERQAVILHLLNSLRAEKGDRVAGKIDFLEGEAISKTFIFS